MNKSQFEYDLICSYFRTTSEPFDFLDWDGKNLLVWNKRKIIEMYSKKDLLRFGILEK